MTSAKSTRATSATSVRACDERRIRCDHLVIVTAEDEADAIEKAKTGASDITMDGYCIDNVSILVDEGIDVKLKQPEEAPSGPSM